jgi:hypothetical protein
LSDNGYYPANKVLDNIVTDGLALLLDSTTATSYPRSGTDILDLSGEGNDGTLTNGPTFNNNGWIDFDGTDDKISIPNPLSHQSNLNQEWTVMACVNVGSKTFQKLVGGLNNGVYVVYSADRTLLYLNGGVNDYYTYGGDLSDVGWVMATFRFRNSDGYRTIWKNGISITTSGPNNTSTPSGIGNTLYIGDGMDGSLSNILIYDRVISDTEVLQNYYQGPIVTDYMTYAFDASNLVSFEPGTTSVYSLTGSLGAASDGTLENGVGFSNIANGYWDFDGVDDKLTLAGNISLGNGNVAWTVSAWVKSLTTVNGLGQGSVASNDGSGPVYSMMGINANKMVYWTYQSGWVQYLGNKTINDGNWHHLTWVNYTNYTMDMYVDGVFDRNVGNSTSGNNNPIDTIGNSWSSRFDGDIASVYFYQGKSLSAAEVQQNYQAKIKKYT